MPEKRKILTLAIPVQDDRVLLGMKKRGFGQGLWNGFGGKLELGETIEEATKREALEECGISIIQMTEAGQHEFRFSDKPEEVLEVHVFRVEAFKGEPEETEEMKPEWFPFAEIPFDHMWLDDRHWFPLFLEEKKFRGQFLFSPNGGEILEWKLEPF